MTKSYWLGRWERGETKWHQSEVEPALASWIEGKKNQKIFIPLCGKSRDMKWLIDQGHTVVGCEFSLLACEAFFTENHLDYKIEDHGEMKIFRGKDITIFGGDIFALQPKDIKTVNGIYDRAALIALPTEVRVKYSAHILRLLEDSMKDERFEFLEIVLVRTPGDLTGPPYSVSPEEVEKLYGNHLDVNLLSRESVDATAPPGSASEECVMLLTRHSGERGR